MQSRGRGDGPTVFQQQQTDTLHAIEGIAEILIVALLVCLFA
jgi:hypothetical protein